jgi:hypothetical protein
MNTPGFFKPTTYVPEFLKEIFGSEDDEMEDPHPPPPPVPSRSSNKTQTSTVSK